MSEPRIPPRSSTSWDAEVLDALSVLRMPDTATPEQRAGRGKRSVPNLLGILTWHPDLAKAFLVFNNHLFGSTLSARAREMVTVRVSWLRRGEYEWAQHVTMARAAGVSEAEIDAISEGPEAAIWGRFDAALLRSVDEIITGRYISDATWKLLEEQLDRKQLMDLVFTIGAYDMLAMAFNNFGLQLDSGLSGFPAEGNRLGVELSQSGRGPGGLIFRSEGKAGAAWHQR